MNALQEKAGVLQQKRDEWVALFEPHKEKMDHPADVVEKMQALNAEMTDLGKEVDRLKALQDQAAEVKAAQDRDNTPIDRVGFGNGNDTPNEKGRKSLGEQFVEHASYKNFASDTRVQGKVASVDVAQIGVKATFTTSASTFTQYDRPPGIILIGNQRLTVADLLAQGQTNANTIRYLQEDTYTNAATAVLEEGQKPEASFDTSEADAPVRKIAVIGRVTDEFFADFPAMRDYIDNRLTFMVGEKEEAYLLNGTGTAPQIKGILQYSGIQTQAKGTDPVETAIYNAITKIRFTGYFEPDGIVMHPNDWAVIATHQDGVGRYIWTDPYNVGPQRLWGLPVVVTTNMTENTALVGGFKMGAQIFRREGIRVESTNSDASDFQYNRIAIRVEERLALAMYRQKAFCTVTGI